MSFYPVFKEQLKKDLCLAPNANSHVIFNFDVEMQASHIEIFKCLSSWIAIFAFPQTFKTERKTSTYRPKVYIP